MCPAFVHVRRCDDAIKFDRTFDQSLKTTSIDDHRSLHSHRRSCNEVGSLDVRKGPQYAGMVPDSHEQEVVVHGHRKDLGRISLVAVHTLLEECVVHSFGRNSHPEVVGRGSALCILSGSNLEVEEARVGHGSHRASFGGVSADGSF